MGGTSDALKAGAGPQIVLLTPYTGDNRGDGAIQDSAIENIVSRVAGARVVLSVLHPRRVAERHGVPTFPITGLEIRSYSLQRESNSRTCREFVQHLAAWPFRIARMVMRETKHVFRTYFLLRRSHLLVVSGGGQIDDYWGGPMGHPYVLFKWAILARAAGTKLVFLSVGVCSLNSKLSAWFIGTSLRLADYRSYRDLGSKQLVATMGFTTGDSVVPDLAFGHASARPVCDVASTVRHTRLRVGVNPIPYFYLHHWPESNPKIFRPYFEMLASFVAALLKDGHEVVLFATDSPDYQVMDLLLDRLKPRGGSEQIGVIQATDVASTGELLAELRALDCAVVSRLHAAILSHLCGNPVLAISYDRKVTQYMADMEQPSYCLDINKTRPEELKETFDLLRSSEEGVKSIVRRKNEEWRSRLLLQYDELARNIVNHEQYSDGSENSWLF